MGKIGKIVAVLAVSIMATVSVAAYAIEMQPQIKSEVVMKEGSMVHLFHSGTADVRKEICVNDVIPVYRETPTGGHLTIKEVGKVKIVSYVGEHYIDAKVVEGQIKPGDVAKKETAACLVQPAR